MKEQQYALRKDIRPDPGQPRKEFPPEAQAELMASITAHGITDPLIVRVDPEGKAKFMVVEGERRWRAAGELKLDRLPIEVREYKDEAAVRAYQRLVGTMRVNLSALEQAASFGQALQAARNANPKIGVTEFAAAQGIPRATAYETIALLKISPVIRKALQEGKLDASKARLFAKVPSDKHEELLGLVEEGNYGGEPLSVRDLQELIDTDYSRQLKDTPFDAKADYLVPVFGQKEVKGGAKQTLPKCAECPKRSGNIEGWIGNPNVCTHVECFTAKTKANTEAVLAKAKAEGKRTMDAKQYQERTYQYNLTTDTAHLDDKNRKWGQLAAIAKVEPVTTVNRAGAAVQVFTRQDCEKILVANKITSGRGGDSSGVSAADKAKRELEEKAIESAITEAGLRASDGYPNLPLLFWRRLAQTVVMGNEYQLTSSPRHWTGRSLPFVRDHGKDIRTLIVYIAESPSPQNLIGLTVQMLMDLQVSRHDADGLKIWGIDWKQFLKEDSKPPTKPEATKPKEKAVKPKAVKAAGKGKKK